MSTRRVLDSFDSSKVLSLGMSAPQASSIMNLKVTKKVSEAPSHT